MGTFALETEDERHLGFLLIGGRGSNWPSAGRYDCIFTGLPHDASLFDDPRGSFVLDHKHQEYQADVNNSGAGMTVRIALDSGWIFELHSHEAASRWFAERDSEKISGVGKFI